MAPKKDYTQEQMCKAIEEVKKGVKIGTAARKYGVPRVTLRNKITGRSPVVCSMGPPTILTKYEEDILVQWLLAFSDRHFTIDKEQLLNSVQQIIINTKRPNPFTDNRPGKKWYQSFLKRHPEISKRATQKITTSRDHVTEDQIRSWFTEIDEYLVEKNLKHILNQPHRVFNTHESAFSLNPKIDLVRRNDKNVNCADDGKKQTVLITANAAGQVSPPMIVFPYNRIPGHISDSVPDSWGIGRSENGWICRSTFYEYITNIFYPWLIENDITLPIIFFLDGQGSHITAHLSDFCSSHGIEVIALYPNSPHLLQPMEVAVFRPLQMLWRLQVTKWKTEHFGEQVKTENFAPIFKLALEDLTQDCIRNGFKAGGLFPFGPEYINFFEINTRNREIDTLKNKEFFEELQSEIVKSFSQEKLDLFNKLYYLNCTNMEKELPTEDTSLYIIWTKYKNLCQDAVDYNKSCSDSQNKTIKIESNPDQTTSTEDENTMEDDFNNDTCFTTDKNNATTTKSNEVSEYQQIINCQLSETQRSINLNFEQQGTSVNHTNLNLIPSTSFDGMVVPSPFEKALLWPQPESKKSKISKEKVPSVITSKAWREFYKQKNCTKISRKKKKISETRKD